MITVLVAQPNVKFANALAEPLLAAGYRAITCPGPWPPALRCIRCDVGYCPLTEAADLLIYDPDLIAYGADGQRHTLAVDSANAQPDVPLLLAWPGDEEPASVAAILAEVPRAQRALRESDDLVGQVRQLVGPPFGSVPARPAPVR
jgi:hypothetical protein